MSSGGGVDEGVIRQLLPTPSVYEGVSSENGEK